MATPGLYVSASLSGFAPRLALVYAGLFGALGVQLPFLPVWFAARGLDEAGIGALLAAATIARVATVPFATRAADRFAGPKGAIVVACLASAACLTVLGAAGHPSAIVALYIVAAAVGAACLPLIEAYALRGLAERGRAYGPVRLWGSAAFIGGTLAAGALLAVIAPGGLIWLLAGIFWFAGLAAMLLVPVRGSAPAADGPPPPKALHMLRDPALVAVLAASALAQGSHALIYGFGTLQWTAAGLGGTTIGLLWSVGVLAEIALFAASARFPPAFGPAALIALGAAGGALRWTAMAFDPPLGALFALQALHALSFGATHLGAVQMAARLAPPGLSATAQGFLATANGIAMAGAMAISGPLHAAYGAGAFGAMAVMAAASGIVLVAARRRVFA